MLFLFLSLLEQIYTKSTGYFHNHINKNGYFYSHEIYRIVHPSLSKDMKGPIQINRDECYSLMLLCLKINSINIRTK